MRKTGKMSRRQISVVIPNYNGFPTLRACIESIFDTIHYPNWELIVIDDGSTDGSLEYLEKLKGIRLFHQPRKGVACALNAGFKAARKNDVVRVHADVVLETSGWLTKLQEVVETNPKVGVVGAKLVFPDDRIQAQGRSIITGLGFWERHANRKNALPDNNKPSTVEEVDTVSGALSYYRREVISEVGGLDENYWPVGTDDDDFCIGARFHGYKVYVQPAVKAVHHTISWSPVSQVYFPDSKELIMSVFELKHSLRKQHLAYWKEKWGWNPSYPDMNEIRRLYGHTEICWRIGEPLRFKPKEWPPTVDACIVTWANLTLLRRCLDSLADTDYPSSRLHVYVSDNGSTDGTAEYLDSLVDEYPFPIHVDHLLVNTGAQVGLNWAFVQGRGELVAKLDDDIVLPKQWLLSMVEDFRRRPFAGVVGPKILNDEEARTIQAGAFRWFPSFYCHEDELDDGQANYFARTIHVRGCCNLYRRDVLKRCGLLDIRYSPSQYDDVDHHIKLTVSGYEVIYDGRVEVIHTLNSGIVSTPGTVSHKEMNYQKLIGKWGQDIFEVIDKTLDLSREGRYLPDDGDTSAYMAQGPHTDEFPRSSQLTLPDSERRETLDALKGLYENFEDIEEFSELLEDYKGWAVNLRHDGWTRQSLKVLHTALNLAPTRTDLMEALASTYLELGQHNQAEVLMRRASRLLTKNTKLQDRLNDVHGMLRSSTLPSATENRENTVVLATNSGRQLVQRRDPWTRIGEANLSIHNTTNNSGNGTNLKVLMVDRFGTRVAGGDMHQIKKTKQYLEQLGVSVDVTSEPSPDPRGYDVIHLWFLWFPHQALPQIKAIRVLEPDIPVVLTPIYWDLSETNWARCVLPILFASAGDSKQLNSWLHELARDTIKVIGVRQSEYGGLNFPDYEKEKYEKLIVKLSDQLLPHSNVEMHNLIKANGVRRTEHLEPNFSDYEKYQRLIIEMSDQLLPQSHAEIRNLWKTLGVEKPYTVVRNAAESRIFDTASADWFVQEYGVRDFIITVGLLEPRKNQLMLLYALGNAGLPIVVVGGMTDRNYTRLCRKFAPPTTIFIEHLPHKMLASAYKAARVYALPSWMECASLANIEAGLAGCSLVVSNRTSEQEYFQDNAYYCDPSDVTSIRETVLNAYENYSADASKRVQLREQILQDYTWERAAEKTVEGYHRALASKGKPSKFT